MCWSPYAKAIFSFFCHHYQPRPHFLLTVIQPSNTEGDFNAAAEHYAEAVAHRGGVVPPQAGKNESVLPGMVHDEMLDREWESTRVKITSFFKHQLLANIASDRDETARSKAFAAIHLVGGNEEAFQAWKEATGAVLAEPLAQEGGVKEGVGLATRLLSRDAPMLKESLTAWRDIHELCGEAYLLPCFEVLTNQLNAGTASEISEIGSGAAIQATLQALFDAAKTIEEVTERDGLDGGGMVCGAWDSSGLGEAFRMRVSRVLTDCIAEDTKVLEPNPNPNSNPNPNPNPNSKPNPNPNPKSNRFPNLNPHGIRRLSKKIQRQQLTRKPIGHSGATLRVLYGLAGRWTKDHGLL